MGYVPFTGAVNFDDISTRSGGSGGGIRIPVAGVYPVTILEAGLNVRDGENPENATSVGFTVQITEGAYEGFKTWINCGRDLSKLGNRITWKTALVSMGYDESALTGEIHIDTDGYVGLSALMKFTPKAEGEKYDSKEFVTPAYYEAWKAKAASGTTATAPATTTTFRAVTTAPVVAPAPAKAPMAPTAARPAVPQPAPGAANKYAGFIAK